MAEQPVPSTDQTLGDSQLPPSSSLSPVTLGSPPDTGVSPTLAQEGISPRLPQQRLGRYEVNGEIGRGGMGAVLRGRDPVLGRDLALKVLLAGHQGNADALRRFHEEAQIGGQLQHPGLVPVYELGAAEGRPFFAMKLVDGRTLTALLKERAKPADNLARFLTIFEQVCQAVGYAHARGVIHRDLKPANVMVGAFGEVQVMDWGLAKVLDAPLASEAGITSGSGTVHTDRSESGGSESRAGSILGTPAYMPPEQARGEANQVDRRADVFGLGAILCEILTAEPPFAGRDTSEVLRRAGCGDLSETLARLDGCGADAELIGLATACLSPEPNDRPGNGAEVAARVASHRAGVEERLRRAELERAAAEVRAVEERRRAAEERRRRRAQLTAAGALLLLLTLAGGGGWYLRQQSLERQAEQARQETERVRRESELARAVDDDLNQLDRARHQQKWDEAEKILERADGRLGQGGNDELRERVRLVRDDLARMRRDQQMVAKLEEARMQVAASTSGGWDKEGGRQRFKEAFAWYGLDLQQGTPDEVAGRIATSPIREEIVTALDQWTQLAARADGLRLVTIVNKADASTWRCQLRAALLQQDYDHLRRLADEAVVGELPPTSIFFLAGALRLGKAPQRAVAVLREGRQRFPADFWLNFNLADALRSTSPKDAEAVRYYTAAQALRPDSVVVHNCLGVALRDQGKLAEAIAEYHEAIRLKPYFTMPHNNLGVALWDQGKLAEAIDEFRKAIQLSPSNAEAHNNLGVALSDQGKLPEAIAEYRETIRLKPDYPDAHNNLGNVLKAQGKLPEAIAEYHEAIRLKPEIAKVHYNLGIALKAEGKLPEAISEYREAIRLEPSYFGAHNNLGLALKDQGKLPEAIAECREAVRLKPDDPGVHYGLGLALKDQGKLPEAIAEHREAIRLKPDYAGAHDGLGTALRAQGKLPEAIAEHREAIRLKPDDPGAHDNLGAALCDQGKLPEAIAEYREAIRLKPDVASAHYGLGFALYTQGKRPEAIDCFREAIRLKPDFADAHNSLGLTLKAQGNLPEAIAALRAAIRLKPDFAEAHNNLGGALQAEGDNLGDTPARPKKYKEAEAAYREAIRVRPDYAEAYCNLGMELGLLGRFADSRDAWRRGHELGSKQPGWRYPSERLLREAEEYARLDPRLPALLKGEDRPADAAEALSLMNLCHFKRLHGAAAHFAADAFVLDPKKADDLNTDPRYDAACYATVGAASQEEGGKPVEEPTRVRLRKLALGWLRADLAAYGKQLNGGKPADISLVAERMRHWQQDTDLVSLRDPEALAKLSESERADWQTLWREVEVLRKRAAAPK